MKKDLLLLLLFFWSYAFAAAQTTTVLEGSIKGAEGKILRAYIYEDYLTLNETIIAQAKISKDGKFRMALGLAHTSIVYLRLDFFQTGIYIERGEKYYLQADGFDPFGFREIINPFLEPPVLPLRIVPDDSLSLNNLTDAFERMYNNFIADNTIAIIRGRDSKLINSFIEKADSAFAHIDNAYFEVYRKYKIAILELSARTKSRQRLFADYLYKAPLHPHNLGYMTFFNQYFTKYFTDLSRINFSDLEYTINELQSFPALKDSLGKDSVLRNEYLREMVLVKGVGELWAYPGFIKEHIIAVLDAVAKESKFDVVRLMAKNQKENLIRFQEGSTAVAFELMDINDKSVSLSRFKGKYVYLFFWNTSCALCMAEMEVMNTIQSRFQGKLEIIGVSLDMQPLHLKYFLQDKSYDFTIAHYGFDYELLDSYNIRNVPFFILFDPEGKISRYPASAPSERLVNDLLWLMR